MKGFCLFRTVQFGKSSILNGISWFSVQERVYLFVTSQYHNFFNYNSKLDFGLYGIMSLPKQFNYKTNIQIIYQIYLLQWAGDGFIVPVT